MASRSHRLTLLVFASFLVGCAAPFGADASTVKFVTPRAGAIVSGTVLRVQVTVADHDDSPLRYRVDKRPIRSVPDHAHSFRIDLHGTAAGKHRLTVWALSTTTGKKVGVARVSFKVNHGHGSGGGGSGGGGSGGGGSGGGGSGPDTTPPSTPGGLTVTSRTTGSLQLVWSASTDNVGVVGYGLTHNGATAGTSTTTSMLVGSLQCGTSYALALTAYDAAGNASTPATLNARTLDCPAVPASVFIAPAGSDSAACTQSAPCKSLNRAYHVAGAGQAVEVAAGSYPGQSISADASKTSSNDVDFRPAAGASVTFGYLSVSASHLTIEAMTVDGWQTDVNTNDVTFLNLNVPDSIAINSSSNISVIGGSVGPCVNCHSQFASWPEGTHISNILVQGVNFHDFSRTDSSVHTECLQIAGGSNVTIRDNRFENCAVFDLSITEYNGSGGPTNYTIENNFFDTATSGGYYSFEFNSNTSVFTNFLVRNNSSTQQMLFDNPPARLNNVRIVANLAPFETCAGSGSTYSHNVWRGGTCSSTDMNVASLGFVNTATFDLHLAAGAAAINHGDPSSYPVDDIDGDARPMGGAPTPAPTSGADL